MKNTLPPCFTLILFCFILGCTDQPTNNNQVQKNSTDSDISVTVKDYETKRTLDQVKVTKDSLGSKSIVCNTSTNGECTLQHVSKVDTFIFSKPGYHNLSANFNDFKDIKALSVYMKPGQEELPVIINLRGFTYNESGDPATGVRVNVDGVAQTETDSTGFYNLNISAHFGQAYQIMYTQKSISATLGLNILQDTLLAEVSVSGFTIDLNTVDK